jgi:cytochrome P450
MVSDEAGAPLSDDNCVALAQMIYSNTLLYVAPATAFLLHSLLSNEEALQRCLAEIDEAFASGPPDLARLEACRYLEAARTESARLHPIGLAAPRLVAQTFEFDGCTLPVGESVLVAVSAAHYLPELYPDPYRFEPERHQAPRLESKRPGAFFPFGTGAHSCLGARLVEAMVLLTVAGLLRHLRVDLSPPGRSLRKRVNPFPEPTDDLVVQVRGHRP